eukprot:GHVS01076334.1.p1 GENE.GHVS01076334.1~~GHVS01076334.1.p1  ORF type:complete len:329 (-),score=89.24 GHVS01076334.1:57-1043(-)
MRAEKTGPLKSLIDNTSTRNNGNTTNSGNSNNGYTTSSGNNYTTSSNGSIYNGSSNGGTQADCRGREDESSSEVLASVGRQDITQCSHMFDFSGLELLSIIEKLQHTFPIQPSQDEHLLAPLPSTAIDVTSIDSESNQQRLSTLPTPSWPVERSLGFLSSPSSSIFSSSPSLPSVSSCPPSSPPSCSTGVGRLSRSSSVSTTAPPTPDEEGLAGGGREEQKEGAKSQLFGQRQNMTAARMDITQPEGMHSTQPEGMHITQPEGMQSTHPVGARRVVHRECGVEDGMVKDLLSRLAGEEDLSLVEALLTQAVDKVKQQRMKMLFMDSGC